jgi:hypothetical protein
MDRAPGESRNRFWPHGWALAALFAAMISGCNDDDMDGMGGPEPDATLAALTLTAGQLDQAFVPDQYEYTTTVGYFVNSVVITATPTDPQANVAIDDGTETIDGTVALALFEGTNKFEIEVTNGSAQQNYTLDITRRSSNSVTQTARIQPVSTPRSYVGTFMAASGDIVVIGAPEDDGNARGVNSIPIDLTLLNSGAAYVYVRDASGNWTRAAYLKASNAEAGDEFGRAVAVSGDTIVVGARGQFDEETDSVSGAAYVFVRSQNGEWQQQVYLKPSASYTERQQRPLQRRRVHLHAHRPRRLGAAGIPQGIQYRS